MPRHYRKSRSWAWISPLIGGPVLLLIGLAIIADELGYELPNRWIALILLLPAGAAIVDSIRLALRQGRWDLRLLARGIAGSLFAAIAILLYLRISTGVLLPILMMALGLGAILRALLSDN